MHHYVYQKKARRSIAAFLAGIAFCPSPLFAKVSGDPFSDQWSYRDTHVGEAWDTTTGSHDTVVAIIDNGFDTQHPELSGNVWVNRREVPDNGADDDKNGYIDDVFGWNFVAEDRSGDGTIDVEEEKGNNDPRPDVTGATDTRGGETEETLHHGTLVAGIIGAAGDNGQLGAGIAWRVRLMNLKVVGNSGSQTTSRMADAIRYAVDNGAHIINISIVGPNDAEIRDAVKYAHEHKVLVVAAAGNDYLSLNQAPRQPVCADTGEPEVWVLGVSGITEAHRLAQFSNRGSDCIDITAPAVNISSTMRYAPRYGLSALYGGSWKGTSFAAPFVSGAAALVKGLQPDWGPTEIATAILSTVQKTPPADEAAYANLFGKGLIRVDRAVAYARDRLPQRPQEEHLVFLSGGRSVVHDGAADASLGDTAIEIPVGITTFVPYRSDGSIGYVGVRPRRAGKGNEAVVFDASWREMRSFAIPFVGPVVLAFGSVGDEATPGVIIAPQSKHTAVFRAYELSGREIGGAAVRYPHRGVSLALVPVASHHEIVAVYADATARGRGMVRAHRFSPSFGVVQAFDIPFLRDTGPIISGDFDGSGEEEFAVGGGAGDAPYLAYYTDGGRELRRTFAYSPEYTGGLALARVDVGRDGRDDVVVAPDVGTPSAMTEPLSATIWRGLSSERLAEWLPFGEGYRRGMRMVALPRP